MKISCENIDTAQLENLSKEKLLSAVKKIIEGYQEQEFEIQKLQHELAQLKRMLFGSRSERFAPAANPQQTALSLDIETVAAKSPATETITYERTKPESRNLGINHKRLPLPAHLERVVVAIEPEEDVTGLKEIGKEITEELDYKPGKLFGRKE